MILKPSRIGVSSEELSVRSLINFIIELQNLFEYIGKYFLSANETIAIAESVTSGFLQFSFSQMKEASTFYKGGITAYTLDEKVGLLNVDEKEAAACDCVSPGIAETMALNVSKIFKTDWSIGVTGYATPVPESRQKLFAYFSIVYKGKVILSEKLDLHSRTRQVNAQLYYTEFILGCLKLELDKHADRKSESMS
ncbi:amidohydrolase, PncC family [Chryseobacterium taichungense]|uniref:Amidohydrolase, PncC family n=1 Tax=Chryseobacterium taichungense TaxID=295069 RepID=A0A1H8C4L1_9FLAO|nr:nicotinamide-nucleotide amidohydrolase family protein [Chryseobacterium taichungense]SEM90111.1 amidohydrolase, PncC family [Chryseobacterium taichungense]